MKSLDKKNDFIISRILFCLFLLCLVCFSFSAHAASTTISYSVSSTNDDAEEQGPFPGPMEALDSSDLEIVYESGTTEQVVGVRFQTINIKQGATSITNAYIQFQADATNAGITNVLIFGEDEDDTVEFSSSNGDISTRTRTTAEVLWTGIPAWNTIGAAGTDQRTADISSIISEIVQRPGWVEGNSIVIMIESDTGCSAPACEREAESFDGTAAPQLVITLDDSDVGSTTGYSVSQSSDDAEEQGAGVPGSAGTMSLTSTDLEHVYDGGTRQVVGMRFQNIAIDQGETGITDAYIQYTVDETDSGTTNVVIYGQDADDTATFTTTAGNITGRTKTTASVLWSGIVAWNSVGAAGTDQRTPDISSIISEIVQRPGWSTGNSITIIIEPGAGCASTACQRTAESFDGTAPPRLVITIAPDENIIMSTTNNSTIGGQAIDQDEAVEYDAIADTGTLFLDDATYDTNANTDAIHMLYYGNLVISTTGNEAIGGNAFLDGDLVEVSPTGTPGVYEYVGIYFAESNFTANEDIDAVYVRDNGNIIISTDANATLPSCGGGNLNFGDDDLIEWDIGSNCATLIINFSPLLSACFDSGGGGNTDEDIWGVHYLDDDEDMVLISLRNDCTLDGQNFEDGDIILYDPSTGTASTYLDESNFASGNEDINALSLALTVTPRTVDHYKIEVLSSGAGSCDPVQIEITAHDETEAPTNVSSGTVLNFSTSTGTSTWGSKLSGTGTWTPAGATATYIWPGGESSVQVELTNVTTVTENINLTDGSATELIGDVVEDPDIDFSSNPLIKITTDGTDDGSIGTDISGKGSDQPPTSQTLYIQLKQSGVTGGGQDACEVPGYYNGAHDVLIAAECINPTICAGNQVSVNGSNVNTYDSGSVPGSGSWTTVSMTFDGTDGVNIDTDNKASLVFNYPDAGQMVLHFETFIDPAGPPPPQKPPLTFSGSSNTFVVRPFGFRIDDFSPTNPEATDGTGVVFTKAGQNFTADITAVVWEATDDDGSQPGSTADDGIPDANSDLSGNATTPNFGNESTAVIADISHTLIAPDPLVITGAESGTLTGNSASGFVAGVIDDHTMSWDEVGIIQLDINESNNDYLSGGQDVTGQVPYVGRFTPANLDVAINQSSSIEDACTTGASPFTYMGEEFYFGPNLNDAPRLRIRGINTAGARTYNYDTTEFFKLDTTTLPRSYSDQSGAAANFGFLVDVGGEVSVINLQEDSNPNGNIFLRLDRLIDGDHFMYDRVIEEAPFTGSVDLTFEAAGLIDTDGVCYDGDGDTICDDTTPTPSASDDDFLYGNISGTSQRFGRLNIGTAVGSELLPISIPFQAEYFDGIGFVLNVDDDCTLIDDVAPANGVPDLVLDNNIETTVIDGSIQICAAGGTSTFTLANTTLAGGNSGLSFSAPGTSCIGYSDVTLDLPTLGIDYLQYDWLVEDGSYDDDPKGRIDFGIFEGPSSYIYIREPW